MDTIKILIAKGNAALNGDLRRLLNAQQDMDVLEAADKTATINCVTEKKPDIVLLNIDLSEKDMIHTIKQIQRIQPSIRVLIFTSREEGAYIRNTLNAGATGYVCIRASDSELLIAIRAIQKGRVFVYLCSDKGLREVLTGSCEKKEDSHQLTWLLSKREKNVLTLVARGNTNREVAKQLTVSIKSVESHRARLMDKLHCRNRADLVKFAIDCGLFESENNSQA